MELIQNVKVYGQITDILELFFPEVTWQVSDSFIMSVDHKGTFFNFLKHLFLI